MYSVTRLLDVAEVDRDRVLTTARAAAAGTGARHQLVAPTLPGVRNGGDILVHLRFNGEEQWRSVETAFAAMLTDPSITRVNGASYSGTASCSGNQAGRVYRSLLLRVDPAADTDTVGRFEDELRLMPRYVNTITAWQLSRVVDPVGTTPWTHVFEQEFTDVGGLMGPYLMHPIHWAVIDRWFDPECPDVIVRDRVCHSFCHCETPVLR
ncbi:stress responsive protein [Mycobacterium sp. ACS1612]|uniref:Dabb family protein n=1 Tax=Mycobacterium sp. ACS1612 TaxID=1834117 RepID=UPI0007FDCA34|nr:Dabb family protein [Mycobacterium sp. ACS1612]OBF30921.1 stress responsive protein [Mycobacterium sp. ACS1612]